MNKSRNILLSSFIVVVVTCVMLVVQAGGLDNFKLRYFFLTKYLNNQNLELKDIRSSSLEPSKNTRINLTQLKDGGPGKDGIPSIDNPRFDNYQTTPFSDQELIIGVVINGEAKAYPYGILNWHEIVNDTLGKKKITISYCPLCDTIVVFERENTTYGVSGKLYQSCLVMYDRSDDTLYSQPWGLGIVGEKVNHSVERLPAIKTTLGKWLEKYPDSKILSTETGYRRDYTNYPYGSYYSDENLIFSVRNQQKRTLHPKAIVSYIWQPDDLTPRDHFSGISYQFPHQQLQQIGTKVVNFQQKRIRARWDKDLETVIVEELDGTPIPSSTAFAFVYPAFFD